ncbi:MULTISPECIES: glycosyl transferase family protein [unclassified Sphingomonas]|uniref:glycosyl transferase family protein n=1 Tax=Novosphingobium rhizosphaerae TaxID=1551649 RepID=UPI0015CBB545
MISLSTVWLWLDMLQRELLLFAAVWLAIGACEEWGIDALWAWLRATGRTRTAHLPQGWAARADWHARGAHGGALRGVAAVFVPAWAEAPVVATMVEHCLAAWPHADLRLYVGCYRNDPETLAAVMRSAHDPRLRIVVHDRDGPTTKADCLNRLYAALLADEARSGARVRSVIVHDAADMVHPGALGLLDAALDHADFVALPVRPEPQPGSRWIAGHYCDEFAEYQAKTMVVRGWLGGGLPAAGVGCAIARPAIAAMAALGADAGGRGGPFAADSLTENYEFGLALAEIGCTSRFLLVRDEAGQLIATRKFFPARLDAALRQKTRWMHGIALQGWDRMGWRASLPDLWMRLRDRRGPMVAMVLAVVYALLVLTPILSLARSHGLVPVHRRDPAVTALLVFDGVAIAWRMALCALFTAREYGLAEGLRAIVRIPLRHAIAIVAARRAVTAYLATLNTGTVTWDHTAHCAVPAQAAIA